ncbi:YheU family protein [Geomobilimonas luticola]|uniref:YheU family protein n=1 Tax=Geomobilimonas luticola TaxID=1114878 RepID=A0ABS5S8F2_9BACT|nr:YheU family protein [Geomobilimonas luticola]
MPKDQPTNYREEGVEVPYERIPPATLRTIIEEFVTREWSDLGDGDYTLEKKVEQVMQQLRERKAKVVVDLVSETANIVISR